MHLRGQFLQNEFFNFEQNVFYQNSINRNLPFEKNYINLRKKEGRIYSDDIVRALPYIPESHELKIEWTAREASLRKLLTYLRNLKAHKTILEIGCGNGWLSHNLVTELDTEVYAIDVNETELIQGARVFNTSKHINFIYGDILTINFPGQCFDVILLPSSLQYFKDFRKVITRLQSLLTPEGVIFILDTPFYHSSILKKVRKRSEEYFNKAGIDEMSSCYFHHTWEDLSKFNYKILFNPDSLIAKFKRIILKINTPAFPIILIGKNDP